MIVHNRGIYTSEEYEGSGLVDTVLSLINGVIQHKDAIKDVVSVAKDAVSIGKDVKSMLPIERDEVPDDVKRIVKKIKALSEGSGANSGEFRYI